MNYYLGLLFFFILGYVIVEAIIRLKYGRKVVVAVRKEDGSVKFYSILKGKDPEIADLIERAKNSKKGSVH